MAETAGAEGTGRVVGVRGAGRAAGTVGASGAAASGAEGAAGRAGGQGQRSRGGGAASAGAPAGKAAIPGQRGGAIPGFADARRARSPKRDGKAVRERLSREAHAQARRGAERPSVEVAVEASNAGRLPELVPLRVGRMAATPFAFLRGSAGLMAYDLAALPHTGIRAQLCGDAHAANFGLYGDARGRLVIDLNDFDETAPGPWEWDLKRLAASLVLAGREAGADEDACRGAAQDAAGAYRRTMRWLSKLPVLEAWNAIADEELVSHTDARDLAGTLDRVAEKARRNTSAKFAAGATEVLADGSRRFTGAPPVLRRVPDAEAASVAGSLAGYLRTLPEDRHPLLARYAVHDVAFRVVGTGSVGTRSYVVLLLDHRGEPLVLQVKEARPSVLPNDYSGHEGRRIILGQKRMQVVSDSLLGWTTIDTRPYQVRQFRNRKGSVDPAALSADQIDDYARMTGALLARAHAHTADPREISGYAGKSEALDEAIATFAVTYADGVESDHAELLHSIKSGRLPAELGA
ncbi:DUF2252 domain-containing protein [Streptomyces boninensis]|uniref:DUF2252 domain-containing protein n=1 Tax=Streptomyces boninensis TaxID=2039455 RepID=UPI003B2237D7